MAQSIRHAIGSKILNCLKPNRNSSNRLVKLYSAIELKNGPEHSPELHLAITKLRKILADHPNLDVLNEDMSIPGIPTAHTAKNLIYKLPKTQFLVNALTETPLVSIAFEERQKIIVEFSSPNIAKPFHVGHLRSTIIGNFIANIFKAFQNDVVRMNYLGDWGTQFGYLTIGMDMAKCSEQELKENPIHHLYHAYIKANKLGETDSSVADRARNIFLDLENGRTKNLDKWKSYREHTVDELTGIYGRLGVKFDEYCWESDYKKTNIDNYLNRMVEKEVLQLDDEGKLITRTGGRCVPIVKSDGTTLYLARDVAALNDRAQRHHFNRMFYVVDHGQSDHFKALFDMGRRMDVPGIDGVEHIKFGRIQGMSTRRGNVVFLKDILDEARDIMQQKQVESTNTRIDDLQNSNTSDILGVSAVIINDLKQRRQRDYEFDWNKALLVNGDTGIKLQYTHCRLYSLEQVTGVTPATECLPELLQEPEAINLIYEIDRFAEVLYKSLDTLEACYLVNYLFTLSNSVSRALKKLNIKEHPSDAVRQQRMLLFCSARSVLGHGMHILGLRPLTKM